jgi:hypothetical protein
VKVGNTVQPHPIHLLFSARIQKILTTPNATASAGAHLSQYRATQRSDDKVFDGRYTVRDDFDPEKDVVPSGNPPLAPPIQIFNIAFARFTARLRNPELNYTQSATADWKRTVDDLQTVLSGIYIDEGVKNKLVSKFLTEILGFPLANVVVAKAQPDGVIEITIKTAFGNVRVLLLAAEHKNEYATGGCDPMVQSVKSNVAWWADSGQVK